MGNIGLSPLLHLDAGKRRNIELATYLGSLVIIPLIMTMVAKTEYTDIFMYTIGPATLVYLAYEMRNFTVAERKNWLRPWFLSFFPLCFGLSSNKVGLTQLVC